MILPYEFLCFLAPTRFPSEIVCVLQYMFRMRFPFENFCFLLHSFVVRCCPYLM
jgi:hypothetical protein